MDRRYVGIDLHRRRAVIYAMDAADDRLFCERIVNDALRLLEVVSQAGEAAVRFEDLVVDVTARVTLVQICKTVPSGCPRPPDHCPRFQPRFAALPLLRRGGVASVLSLRFSKLSLLISGGALLPTLCHAIDDQVTVDLRAGIGGGTRLPFDRGPLHLPRHASAADMALSLLLGCVACTVHSSSWASTQRRWARTPSRARRLPRDWLCGHADLRWW